MWAEAEAKAENYPKISCLSNQEDSETFYLREKNNNNNNPWRSQGSRRELPRPLAGAMGKSDASVRKRLIMIPGMA